MNKRLKWLRVVIGIAASIAIANWFYPSVWFSDAIAGVVIDAETKAPVANAVISATWILHGWEGYPVAYLQSLETTSNSDGEFEIPGWGPRFHFSQGRIARTQPEIRVLAAGYLPLNDHARDATSAFFYAGRGSAARNLALQTATLDEEYQSALDSVFQDFSLVRDAEGDGWTRLPCTTARVAAARQGLKKMGTGIPPASNSETLTAKCARLVKGKL